MNTLKEATLNDDNLHIKQKANKDKISDKLSYMNVSESNLIEDFGILKGEKENKNLFIFEYLKTAEVSKMLSKQSDECEITSDSKDNAESLQVNDEKKSETLTKQISTKTIINESSEKIESILKKDKNLDNNNYNDEKQKTLIEQSINNKDLNDSAHKKSIDLSLTESKTSTLKAEETFSLQKTDSFREKKTDYTQENDREQLEDKRGKFLIVCVSNHQQYHQLFDFSNR